MKVTVKALKKDRTAFVDTNEEWHNMGYKKTLPQGVKVGSVVELGESTNVKGYTNITTLKIVGEASTTPPPASTSGKGFSREELIIRQNALTNAVKFSEGKDATVDEVISIMEGFADAVLNGMPEPEDTVVEEVNTSPAEESPPLDDDIPY